MFIPLYAAAVLIGGSVFVASVFGMPYSTALLVFSVIIALCRGRRSQSVMYSDALQGSIMFVGMFALLVSCYWLLGGVTERTEADRRPAGARQLACHRASGLDGDAEVRLGQFGYNLWWTVISTITLGVGIGYWPSRSWWYGL